LGVLAVGNFVKLPVISIEQVDMACLRAYRVNIYDEGKEVVISMNFIDSSRVVVFSQVADAVTKMGVAACVLLCLVRSAGEPF